MANAVHPVRLLLNTFRDSYGQQWHEVIALPIEKDMSELPSLLFQQRVEHRITENNGEQIVWVNNPELIPQLQEFIQQWQVGAIKIARAEDDDSFSGFSERLPRTENFFTQLIQAPVTAVLLLLCIMGSLVVAMNFSFLHYSLFTFSEIYRHSAAFNETLQYPFSQPWRFITPIFLHFGLMHILGNGLFLWFFGIRLEKVFGPAVYIIFIVSVGIVSNAAQYMWASSGNFGGFSGVNYAFVGYLLIRQIMNPDHRLNVPSGLIWFPIITMVLGMFGIMDFLAGGAIANTAHATGFVLGITWAFLTSTSALKPAPKK